MSDQETDVESKRYLPSLGEYIAWLKNNGGACQTGFYTRSGKMRSTVKLIGPEGHELPVANGHDERLSPSTVAHFDRVLKVDSPFVKLVAKLS